MLTNIGNMTMMKITPLIMLKQMKIAITIILRSFEILLISCITASTIPTKLYLKILSMKTP